MALGRTKHTKKAILRGYGHYRGLTKEANVVSENKQEGFVTLSVEGKEYEFSTANGFEYGTAFFEIIRVGSLIWQFSMKNFKNN